MAHERARRLEHTGDFAREPLGAYETHRAKRDATRSDGGECHLSSANNEARANRFSMT